VPDGARQVKEQVHHRDTEDAEKTGEDESCILDFVMLSVTLG
jgi:hypothetical protein